MKTWIFALCLVPAIAFSGPLNGRPGGGNGRNVDARVEQNERRLRMLLLVGISEALGLGDAEAVQVDATLRRFDDRRRPLRQDVQASLKTLERASDGDAAALAQVDQATTRIYEDRAQQGALDKEEFNELSKNRTTQQRARLGLFFVRYHQRLQQMNLRGVTKGRLDGSSGPGIAPANEDDR